METKLQQAITEFTHKYREGKLETPFIYPVNCENDPRLDLEPDAKRAKRYDDDDIDNKSWSEIQAVFRKHRAEFTREYGLSNFDVLRSRETIIHEFENVYKIYQNCLEFIRNNRDKEKSAELEILKQQFDVEYANFMDHYVDLFHDVWRVNWAKGREFIGERISLDFHIHTYSEDMIYEFLNEKQVFGVNEATGLPHTVFASTVRKTHEPVADPVKGSKYCEQDCKEITFTDAHVPGGKLTTVLLRPLSHENDKTAVCFYLQGVYKRCEDPKLWPTIFYFFDFVHVEVVGLKSFISIGGLESDFFLSKRVWMTPHTTIFIKDGALTGTVDSRKFGTDANYRIFKCDFHANTSISGRKRFESLFHGIEFEKCDTLYDSTRKLKIHIWTDKYLNAKLFHTYSRPLFYHHPNISIQNINAFTKFFSAKISHISD